MDKKAQYPPLDQYDQPRLPPTVSAPRDDWWNRNQKNKPQSNSAGSGCLILMSGGMNMAWSFNPFAYGAFNMVLQMRLIWFIFAIVGALLSAVLCTKFQKKFMLLFSSLLVVIAGILFVSLPNDFDAIFAARCMDGLATGLTMVPSLMLIGEEMVPSMRGMSAGSLDAMCFSLGIYVQLMYQYTWTAEIQDAFSAGAMQGSLMILYGVLTLVLIQMLMIESPVFMLQQNREPEALDNLRRLQRPFTVTQETYEQLIEHKAYVAANGQMTLGQAAVAGLPALLKLSVFRGLVALSFSLYVLFAMYEAGALYTLSLTNQWPMILFGTARWLATLIGAFMLDPVGRRPPMVIGFLVSGVLAIVIGVYLQPLRVYGARAGLVGLLIVYQLFAGLAVVPSSAYLTEAFPLAVKPYYTAAAFIVEMLVQIIILAVGVPNFNSLSVYFYVLAALSLAWAIFGAVCMPETKKTSLREAQQLFRAWGRPAH